MTSAGFAIFAAFVAATLVITAWAARRSGSREQYYTAGGNIGATANGFALAGDFLSAAAFLGVVGLYFSAGLDGLIYGLGALIGWPALLFVIAERLRRLGRFTLTDVLVARFDDTRVRVFSACANLLVLSFYMVSQVVAAGLLVELVAGIDYAVAAVVVGCLMLIYVVFGGMVATTWVQVVKCTLLILAAIAMALLVLGRFEFNVEFLARAAISNHPKGAAIMAPGGLIQGAGAGLSLALALMFGPAGLPHVLMRFFTVSNPAAARRSACVATVLIGLFCFLIAVVGYGAIALLPNAAGKGGDNMVAVSLAGLLGGDLFFGFVAAAAFATILAVVSGLTLAAAATVSHDLYEVVRRDRPVSEKLELFVSRAAALTFGAVCIALSLAFREQNITFLSATALSVAASATFPVLLLAMYWPGLTANGAIAGGLVGLGSALAAIILGPLVWVSVLRHGAPLFPYQYPTILSMPLAFLAAFAGSWMERRQQNANASSITPDP